MRPFSLLALLLFCACGELEPVIAAPVMDNPECRQEAMRSPEVRNVARESNFTNQTQVRALLTEQREAEARIYDACLRRRGLPQPGGVEPIRRI